MKAYKNLLFDLDGTLTDPREGITKCIAYALEALGIVPPELHELNSCIGPPLRDTFMRRFGLDEAANTAAIDKYRERFAEVGLFENLLFEGVPQLLEDLKSQGYRLFLATSKPEVFAREILQHFKIDSFFDFAAGAALDESRPTKGDVIRYLMHEASLTKAQDCLMIGDREHDVHGAQSCQMQSVGVLYGFGSYQELNLAGADYIVKDIPELRNLLLA